MHVVVVAYVLLQSSCRGEADSPISTSCRGGCFPTFTYSVINWVSFSLVCILCCTARPSAHCTSAFLRTVLVIPVSTVSERSLDANCLAQDLASVARHKQLAPPAGAAIVGGGQQRQRDAAALWAQSGPQGRSRRTWSPTAGGSPGPLIPELHLHGHSYIWIYIR